MVPRLSALLFVCHLILLAAISQNQRTLSSGGLAEALARKAKCPEGRDVEMDVCASRMGFLGDHQFTVPKNSSAMGSFCTQLKQSIECIQNYSRDCLQGFTRQILNSLLKRGKQQYSSFCQTSSSRADFMSKMSCLTDSKIGQFHSCMDASIARFEYIRSQVVAENRLPSLCCSYQIYFADTSSTLDKLCGPDSKTGKFVQKVVTGTTGEFLQIICDNHRTYEDCRASDKTRKTLGELESVTQRVKSGQHKPKNKSIITPLIDILHSSS